MPPNCLPDAGPPRPARRALLRGAALAVLAVAGRAVADSDRPLHVLIVHSFGREFAPYDAAIATFRRELASRARRPVVFLEAALDAGRPIRPGEEAAFVAYLAQRFTMPAPELVVASAGPAARFLVRHRAALFPQVPLLLTAVDARMLPSAELQPGDAAVVAHVDLRRAIDAMLQLRPQTRTVAVVLGSTPLERFWRKELERDVGHLGGRVQFDWMDGLSLAQMKQRVAALPPDSAVFYALLVIDAAGVPHERLEALAELHKASVAPIFSLFENEIGQGVVGGPTVSQTRIGHEAARLALARLEGPEPPAPEVLTVTMGPGEYDARELARWQIDPAWLPPDAVLRFDEPSIWARYQRQILLITGVMAAQAALIGALLVQRARRQRAETEARTLGGRLITAYEDEGRRLGRELHDDVTQRLAGLSIEAATLGRLTDPAARQAIEHSISSELARLSRDVHALSYRLHPSVVDDLGLEEALRVECERASRRGPVPVAFDCAPGTPLVRGDVALGLFRVAQEALRNALRHAQAGRVTVGLRAGGGGAELSVADDGQGFDAQAGRERASLGLASMRERVVLLGGRLEIHSRRGQGTRVTAWVPVAAAS